MRPKTIRIQNETDELGRKISIESMYLTWDQHSKCDIEKQNERELEGQAFCIQDLEDLANFKEMYRISAASVNFPPI